MSVQHELSGLKIEYLTKHMNEQITRKLGGREVVLCAKDKLWITQRLAGQIAKAAGLPNLDNKMAYIVDADEVDRVCMAIYKHDYRYYLIKSWYEWL